MTAAPYGIHWFRRDLRLRGNLALLHNLEKNSGRVLCVFFVDRSFLARPDFSPDRFAFFLESLAALREELQSAGGSLLVLERPPLEGFAELIPLLGASPAGRPALLSFNRDYEPFARERDRAVEAAVSGQYGVPCHTERDHLILEPHELSRPDGSGEPYQVFGAFARRWFEKLRSPEINARLRNAARDATKEPRFQLNWEQLPGLGSQLTDRLKAIAEENRARVSVPIPASGERAARAALDAFIPKLPAYGKERDFPATAGTSRLSIFLKNGSLTTAEIAGRLELAAERYEGKGSTARFLKELVWREFYYHILFHSPRVEKEAFQERYRDIRWENQDELFEAWKEGRTGYPLVDAGMRELKLTGWMHNRVRMVVASFLTKDLLIDWRWGERYFMQRLLDGDLAANNGGWQWAASTGCDPQPYFRIFNPTLQSRKFDPDGNYIRKYVPERAGLKGKALHEPKDPVVVHASRRIKALSLYRPA